MSETPAARYAATIAALREGAIVLPLGAPDWSWRARPPNENAVEMGDALTRAIERIDLPRGVLVVFEGLCRVTYASHRGGRSRAEGGTKRGGKGTAREEDGSRFTALVVHITADDEPARVVLLPTE
jgi:hypothetical protein